MTKENIQAAIEGGTDEGAIADLDQPANLAPAAEVDTSGSPQQIVPDVDLNHPAVDSNPRKDTTVAQNRIDFNDPSISGPEAVEKALGYGQA